MKASILLFAFGMLGLIGCAAEQAGGGQDFAGAMLGRPGAAQPSGMFANAISNSVRPAPADFFAAAARGDLRGVQGALAQGAAVDARNLNGATALLLAASSGSLPVVRTLLGAGADVDAADDAGRTPLSAATSGGYDDVIRALKAAGAQGAAEAAPAPQSAPGQWWQTGGSH
jgi:hypothetical protein